MTQHLNGSEPTEPTLPPIVNYAYNVRHQILPRIFSANTAGPVDAIKAQLREIIKQLDGLPDSAKFEAFVRAGRKHGVKLSVNIYVEEPQS